jgi:hypothetical protein
MYKDNMVDKLLKETKHGNILEVRKLILDTDENTLENK